MRNKIPVTVGNTNVYADLGYDNPEEALAKAQPAARISEIIETRKLTM